MLGQCQRNVFQARDRLEGNNQVLRDLPSAIAGAESCDGALSQLHVAKRVHDPPYVYTQAWETLADQYGFVMVWPVSTYNPSNHSWYWDVYETDSTFPVVPDDSGFLRSLITAFQSQYNVSPGRTFVAGMSSGGFMAHRVGTDLSDIVAAIAPVSGMIDIHPIGQDFDPPLPTNPVSVFELHGDEDTEVAYCGGSGWFWGKLHDD